MRWVTTMPDPWAQFQKDAAQWATEAESAAEFRSRTPATTKAQMIEAARKLDAHVKTIMDALEAFYGNGFTDEIGGNVECPSTGHYYRVDRWIVTTNDRGFRDVWIYGTIAEAQAEFQKLEDEFSKWDMGE